MWLERRIRTLPLRLRSLFRRSAVEAELDEELRYHLERHVEENLARGMAPDEALAAARRAVGPLGEQREACRDARGLGLLEDFVQDLRYCVRTLRKSPAFTAGAVLSLALGVGANAAIFHLIDVVLLRPLPVARPDELALIRIADQSGARGNFLTWGPALTNLIWEQVRDRQTSFSGVFAWGDDTFDLTSGGEPRVARGLWVSGSYFDALGVRPELGRLVGPDDDRRGGGGAVVVVSHAFWQRELGGDPGAVGRTIRLDRTPCEIVGVAPPEFTGLEVGRSFDVALPIAAQPLLRGDDSLLDAGTTWWLTAMGRLAPGVTTERASSELAAISRGVFEASLSPKYPKESVDAYLGFTLGAEPAATGVSQLRETYEAPLRLLLAVAGLVLLIACANLANLLLARATAREREIAVRLALGAGRGRVMRQLLSESLALAVAGAVAGSALALWLTRALVALLASGGDALVVDLGVDWRVFAFTAAVAAATCMLFGLAPAVRASRTTPESVLRGARGATGGGARSRLRRALIVAQVALSVVLVAAAFLFARSFERLVSADTGLRATGVVVAVADASRRDLPKDRRVAWSRELVERVRALPGVDAAGEAAIVPLTGASTSNDVWMDDGDRSRTSVRLDRVGEGFFATFGMRLLAGRDFGAGDSASSPAVAVVNESFARRVAGDANPVGRRFWIQATPSAPETRYEIVGVVSDAKYRDVHDEVGPGAFLAWSQTPDPDAVTQIAVHGAGPADRTAGEVRAALSATDPSLTVSVRVYEDALRASTLAERLLATLSACFGLLALALASAGLYGILSYGVASRTVEIGVRLALGARRADVARMVLGEAAGLVLVGLAIGLPGALALARVGASLLYGVTPADPLSLGLAAATMAAVAALAAWLPARRATGVDPMSALRTD